MILLLISLLLFALGAFFNAVMDTLSHHFMISIFKDKDPSFWNPWVSGNVQKFVPGTKYRIDAWHLSKSAMIISLALSAVILIGGIGGDIQWWWYLLIFVLQGLVWNGTFNLFYNHLLLDIEDED